MGAPSPQALLRMKKKEKKMRSISQNVGASIEISKRGGNATRRENDKILHNQIEKRGMKIHLSGTISAISHDSFLSSNLKSKY